MISESWSIGGPAVMAAGSAGIAEDLAARYPHLTGIQRDRLQATIIRLRPGLGSGVIRSLPDGSSRSAGSR